MTPTETRDNAYHQLKLGDRQKRVLAIIEAHAPISNRDIAWRLGWPVHCVTGRCKELREAGKVEQADTFKDPVTRVSVARWRAVRWTVQGRLAI